MASFTILTTGARSDRNLRETHWLSWITNPFLVVALVILQLFPGLTKDLFAGIIQPGMSPMLLGAAYRGGIVFWQVARGSRWSAVTVGSSAVNFRRVDGGRFGSALGSVSLWRAGVYPLGASDCTERSSQRQRLLPHADSSLL
jgi:hypothetical protein